MFRHFKHRNEIRVPLNIITQVAKVVHGPGPLFNLVCRTAKQLVLRGLGGVAAILDNIGLL